MALNLSGTSGIVGAGIGTIGPSGANVTGVVTCTSVVSSTGVFNGKVGISTGTHNVGDNQLLIRAASTVGTYNGHIMLTGDGATVGEGPQIVFSESGSGSSYAGAYVGHVRTGSNSIGDLVFGTRASSGDTTTTPTERLRIDSSGYVGIRETSPASYYSKDLVLKCAAAEGGMTIRSNATTDTNYVMFADGTSGNEQYRGYIAYHHNSGTSGGEHIQLGVAGNSRVYRFYTDGVALGGETATDNRLDDYEEGTWTPVCKIETREASDSPIDGVDGCYTKVGSVVTCHGKFSLNGTPSERSTSRAIEIHGFPFDHNHDWDKVSGDVRVTGHLLTSTYGDDISFILRMIPGSQYCRLELLEHSYNGTRNASVVMQDDMYVVFSFTYVTV